MSKRPKSLVRPGQIRIIAGRWRGRRLEFPAVSGLRPTGDRLRETLFNWLMPDLPGARCLDLFAGSGALGLEAASRHAGAVVLVEKDAQACRALQQHCSTLQANTVMVAHCDALTWLQTSQAPGETFDIVFLDPPFDSGLLADSIAALQSGSWLAADALIYTESAVGQSLSALADAHWKLCRHRIFGAVDCRLYRHPGYSHAREPSPLIEQRD